MKYYEITVRKHQYSSERKHTHNSKIDNDIPGVVCIIFYMVNYTRFYLISDVEFCTKVKD